MAAGLAAWLLIGKDGGSGSVVWAVGDGATADHRGAELVDGVIVPDHPDRFLYLGDVYETGTRAEFDAAYDGVYGDLRAITSPTAGDHEWESRAEGYDRYWEDVRGEPYPAYYKVDLAGWEILSLNSEHPHDEGSAQVRWLRSEVSEAGDCRIAFWHRPRFSAGKHGDNEDTQPLWTALQGRAKLVLGGDDHAMQRFRPVGGLVQIVAGSGGRPLYSVDRDDERLAFADDRRVGALRMELEPGRAELSFVDERGTVLDKSSLSCRPLR